MSDMNNRGKVPVWTFYEHSFQAGVTLAWKQSPDGDVSYLGRVEPGSTGRLAVAFSRLCRPSRLVMGLPSSFDGMLN